MKNWTIMKRCFWRWWRKGDKIWQVVRDGDEGLAQLRLSSASSPWPSEVHSWHMENTKRNHEHQVLIKNRQHPHSQNWEEKKKKRKLSSNPGYKVNEEIYFEGCQHSQFHHSRCVQLLYGHVGFFYFPFKGPCPLPPPQAYVQEVDSDTLAVQCHCVIQWKDGGSLSV